MQAERGREARAQAAGPPRRGSPASEGTGNGAGAHRPGSVAVWSRSAYRGLERAGSAVIDAASKRDARAQTKDRLIAEPAGRIGGTADAAAGMKDILEIRLQLPPAGELPQIGDLDGLLVRAHRERQAGEKGAVAIEGGGAAADVGEAVGDPELVVLSSRPRSLQGNPGIQGEVDKVAVAGRPHRPHEHAERARGRGVRLPDRLIDDAVKAEIAAIQARDAGACRRGERQAGGVEALVGKRARIGPYPELVGAGQRPPAGKGRMRDRILDLAEKQRAGPEVEAGARGLAVAHLQVVEERAARRVVVEHAGEH